MEVPRYWRMNKQRYALVGETCPNCHAPIFPARVVCPNCGGDAKNAYAVHEQQPALSVMQVPQTTEVR